MSLTRTPRARTKKAHALTDPKPNFISLVKAGANKTPFLAVRSATLVGREAEDFLMTVKKQDIAKITFKAETFADEAAVKAWLDQGGYEGFEIKVRSEGGFEVIGDETLTDIRRIETDTGLVIYTGKAAAAEGEGAEGAEVAGEAEVAAKTTAETRAAGVVAKAEGEAVEGEAAPAGTETQAETAEAAAEAPVAIEAAAVKAEGATLIEGGAITAASLSAAHVQPVAQKADIPATIETVSAVLARLSDTGIQTLAKKTSIWTVQDLSSLLSTLKWMVADAEWNGLSDASISTIKQAGASLISVLIEAMQSVIDAHVEAFTAQKAAEETRAKSEPDPALAALSAQVAQMQAQLTQLTADKASLEAETASAKKAATEAEARAKAAEEARRPTRKGADVGDAQTTASTEKPAKKQDHELNDSEWLELRMRADTIGIIG